MSESIVSCLPFIVNDDDARTIIGKFIDIVSKVRRNNRKKSPELENREQKIRDVISILKNKKLAIIYKKNDFLMAHAAHKLRYEEIVRKTQSYDIKNKMYIDTTEYIFEKLTKRERRNNEAAFRIFASLIRWKDILDERARRERKPFFKKHPPPQNTDKQYSLYK